MIAIRSAVGSATNGKQIEGKSIKNLTQDEFSSMLNNIADSVESEELALV